jgi:competence protein ComEC
MDDQYGLNISIFVKIAVFSILIVGAVFFYSKYFGKSIIVFCDVGQGDAAYIRTESGIDVVIDFGPGKKVVECLGKYMPFYDSEIDIALISHFDKDHYDGISYLAPKYKIKRLIYPTCNDKNCQNILNTVKGQKKPYSKIDIIKAGDIVITPLNLPTNSREMSSNDDSEVFRLDLGKISTLFTGDANLQFADGLLDKPDYMVDILKVPHHGSRYNLNSIFLELAEPLVSVISVGKNNQYGHPHKETISLLKALNKNILRTDEEGDILIELSQEGFVIRSQKSKKEYLYKYR